MTNEVNLPSVPADNKDEGWRERFEKTFCYFKKGWRVKETWEYLVLDFIAQEIAQAEKRGAEAEGRRIAEACNKQICEEVSIYGTDKHGLSLEDLKEIINHTEA